MLPASSKDEEVVDRAASATAGAPPPPPVRSSSGRTVGKKEKTWKSGLWTWGPAGVVVVSSSSGCLVEEIWRGPEGVLRNGPTGDREVMDGTVPFYIKFGQWQI